MAAPERGAADLAAAARLPVGLEIGSSGDGRLELIRRPVPPEREVTPASDELLLPQLPVEVIVRAFQLKDLSSAKHSAGVAAQIGADGEARLGDPAQGLNFRLDAKRLDVRHPPHR